MCDILVFAIVLQPLIICASIATIVIKTIGFEPPKVPLSHHCHVSINLLSMVCCIAISLDKTIGIKVSNVPCRPCHHASTSYLLHLGLPHVNRDVEVV